MLHHSLINMELIKKTTNKKLLIKSNKKLDLVLLHILNKKHY